MLLSVVIPCYNEASNLDASISGLVKLLRTLYVSRDMEIILVIEECTDNTMEIAYSLKKDYSFIKILVNSKKYGKGYSVKRGVLESVGETILVTDADLPINLDKYLDVMLLLLQKSPNSAAVYATAIWDKVDFKKRKTLRVLASFSLLVLRHTVLKQDISDSQLGCKLYRGDVVRRCISEINMNGFLYEIYLTDLIFQEGFTIEECAVRIHNFGETSSVKVGDIFQSLFIFLRYTFGKRRRMFKKSYKENLSSSTIRGLFIILGIMLSLMVLNPIIHAVAAAQQSYVLKVAQQINEQVTSDPTKNVVQPYSWKKSNPHGW